MKPRAARAPAPPAMRPLSSPRRRPARSWLLALSLLAACATGKRPPGQPELKDLNIEGNHAIGTSEIKDKIATTEDSWIPFSEAKYLDRAVLDSDTKRIERLYQVHGFFSAKVTDVQVTPVKGESDVVTVKIQIDEGQPTSISELHVDGDEGLPPEVHKALTLAVRKLTPGRTFNEDEYDAAKATLGSTLRNAGYAESQVRGEVVVDPKARTAIVTFTLTPGERYTIGRILVSGTSKVPRDRVEQKVASAAPPGELYSDKAVQDAQNRVFDMGVFSLAKVSRGAPDPETHTLPLAVDVREAPFRTLRLGGGFGIERTRQELRAQGEYVNRNFFGDLRRLDWDNRLAYVLIPDLLNYFRGEGTQDIAGYSKLTFTQPDFGLTNLDLNVTGQLQRDVQVGYTYNSALLGVGLEKRWGREFDLLVQYNFELLQLNTGLTAQDLVNSRAPQLTTDCPLESKSCFLRLQFLEQRFTVDLRDSTIQPRNGFYGQVDFQEGGGPGASFTYLRVEPEVRGYLPLGKRLVVAQRLQWGWMKAFGTQSNGQPAPTPITQRFFAGGANSIRAYGSRLMSPVAITCRNTDPAKCVKPGDFQAVPLGGEGLYLASTELRYALRSNIGLVGFVDVSAVPTQPFSVRAQDIAIAPGIGFRYYTLFGPIRLDFAYRLPGFGADDGQLRLAPSQVVVNYPPRVGSTLLTPGATGRFDFQFSIGEAF